MRRGPRDSTCFTRATSSMSDDMVTPEKRALLALRMCLLAIDAGWSHDQVPRLAAGYGARCGLTKAETTAAAEVIVEFITRIEQGDVWLR